MTEDAEVLVVAVGVTARCAKGAIEQLRAEGKKVGLFRPITLWPFPAEKLAVLAAKAKAVMTVELNEGQLYEIVKCRINNNDKVAKLTQSTGQLLTAEQIMDAVKELEQ